MNPILVPTLSELGQELDRAYGIERAALTAATVVDADRGSPINATYEQAVDRTSGIIDQIAALPATTLADLRVKARALDWYHQTVEGPSFGTASPDERLAQQIVAGLLDERISW